MQHYDVAIVGGGLAGASLAHALAATDLKVVLLDKQPAAQLYQPELDNRGLVLSYLSAELLSKWHIWPKLAANATPIIAVHVSTQGRFGFSKFTAERMQLPVLGYVVAASALGAALLWEIPKVTVKRPVTLEKLTYVSEQGWDLTTSHETFGASLLIGADGSDSMVRKYAGIGNEIYSYQETAISANLDTELSTTTAYERFTKRGILALLPFGSKRVKCVLTVPNDQAPSIMRATDQEFLRLIQELFGDRLGRLSAVTPRMQFPLQQIQAKQLAASSLILLGNAANTLHPVAAQGFNLALRDIMVLADLLATIDLYAVPAQYASMRQHDQQSVRDFTHLLAILPDNVKYHTLLAGQFLPPLNAMLARRGLGTWV